MIPVNDEENVQASEKKEEDSTKIVAEVEKIVEEVEKIAEEIENIVEEKPRIDIENYEKTDFIDESTIIKPIIITIEDKIKSSEGTLDLENKEHVGDAHPKNEEEKKEENDALIKIEVTENVNNEDIDNPEPIIEEEVPKIETVPPQKKEEPKLINDEPTNDTTQSKVKAEDAKEVELNELHKCLLNAKLIGNEKFTQQKYADADEQYGIGIQISEDFFKTNEDKFNFFYEKYPSVFEQILLQRKLLYSNLGASFQKQGKLEECVKIDIYVITSMDVKYDKSYARIINCALEMNDLRLANQYADAAKMHCSQELLNKYIEYFNKLEQKNNEAEKALFKKMQANKKASDQKVNEKGVEKDIKGENTSNKKLEKSTDSKDATDTSTSDHEKQKVSSIWKNKWLKWFGPIIFVGTASALFFLYKKRFNFNK